MNGVELSKQYDVEDTIEDIKNEETDLATKRSALEDLRDNGIATVKEFRVRYNKRMYNVTVTLEEDGTRHYDMTDERGDIFDVAAEVSDSIIALVDESGE